jgi:hypothetical protein
MSKGLLATLTVLGGAGALVAVQWPELQRYLKISRM